MAIPEGRDMVVGGGSSLSVLLMVVLMGGCSGSSEHATDATRAASGGSGGAAGSPTAGSGAAAPADASAFCIPGKSIGCVGPGACQGGQACNPDGRAYGACVCTSNEAGGSGGSPGLDGALDASSGGSAGIGGAARDGAPEASVHDGQADADAAWAASDGGDGGAPVLDAPCSTLGALNCNGHAQQIRLRCDGTTWVSNGACSGTQLCDTGPGANQGSCGDPVPACIGHLPGDPACSGAFSGHCGPDLLTFAWSLYCPNACVAGQCTGNCVPGEESCVAGEGQTCSAVGEWVAGGCTGRCFANTCFAAPYVETICPGTLPAPLPIKWVSQFDNTANDLDPALVPNGWEVHADTVNGNASIIGGQGPITPISLSPWGSYDAASTKGMRLQGEITAAPPVGYDNWGALWQYETAVPSQPGVRPVFDLSTYTGIVIWARLAGAPGKGNLTVAFPTPATDPSAGLCGCGSAACASCGAHFQLPYRVTKTCWTTLVTPFAGLKIPYGNTPPSGFDKAHVYGVEIAVTAVRTAIRANWPADVIVDDIYLY